MREQGVSSAELGPGMASGWSRGPVRPCGAVRACGMRGVGDWDLAGRRGSRSECGGQSGGAVIRLVAAAASSAPPLPVVLASRCSAAGRVRGVALAEGSRSGAAACGAAFVSAVCGPRATCGAASVVREQGSENLAACACRRCMRACLWGACACSARAREYVPTRPSATLAALIAVRACARSPLAVGGAAAAAASWPTL